MTSGKDTMGEQPIFTCKAHVFHIDPKTKRSWMPASSTAVSVSFFYDSSRSLYRIISVEGSKAVINSTVTPNMTFTKTSQKFGQWSDVRANTVYGLGFSSEAELQKFIDKFNEVKDATRSAITKVTANGGAAVTPITSANASPITARAATGSVDNAENLLEPPGSAMMSNTSMLSNPPPPKDSSSDEPPQLRSHSLSGPGGQNESPSHQSLKSSEKGYNTNSAGNSTNNDSMQLKYENDRLKLALAQSSANAKKWEIELSTLKNNNSRLTSALQESTANVEEWKRQLHTYKEENLRMKNKYQSDLENSKGGGELADELRKEIQSLRIRVEQLETELEDKSSELKHNQKLSSESIQLLQKDNEELLVQSNLAQTELDASRARLAVISTLNYQLQMRLQDLATIHHEIRTALQTWVNDELWDDYEEDEEFNEEFIDVDKHREEITNLFDVDESNFDFVYDDFGCTLPLFDVTAESYEEFAYQHDDIIDPQFEFDSCEGSSNLPSSYNQPRTSESSYDRLTASESSFNAPSSYDQPRTSESSYDRPNASESSFNPPSSYDQPRTSESSSDQPYISEISPNVHYDPPDCCMNIPSGFRDSETQTEANSLRSKVQKRLQEVLRNDPPLIVSKQQLEDLEYRVRKELGLMKVIVAREKERVARKKRYDLAMKMINV